MMTASEFNETMIPLSGRLYRFAWRYLEDKEESKDAVQEVFVKLWNMRDQIRDLNSVEAFAMRVTRNHCLDLIKRNRTVSLDGYAAYYDAVAEEDDPSAILQRNESVRHLQDIIRRLPEPQRSVILLKDVEGFEPGEICDQLHINDGNFRVILSRARRKVREEFEKLYANGNKKLSGAVAGLL